MLKKYIRTLLLFLNYAVSINGQTDYLIFNAINKVNVDSLKANLRILTGVDSFYINGGYKKITSRHKESPGNVYAREYLIAKLSSYGLKVEVEKFEEDGENIENIIVVQKGRAASNRYVIICAHYDSMPSKGDAPGADDNGSGTAAVIETARIISSYDTKYSVVYAFWDNEEQGLHGSNFYATNAALRGDSIIAVINLDMIGWDGNNDFKADLHSDGKPLTSLLAEEIISINKNYLINLDIELIYPGTSRSDHYSFWLQNYPAVLLIEDFYSPKDTPNDFNPYYHSPMDQMWRINYDFYKKMTQLALASVSSRAEILSKEGQIPLVNILYQNYPNPFNSSTVISYFLANDGNAKLKIYDLTGREVASLVDRYHAKGLYQTNFAPEGKLASGIYYYALITESGSEIRKLLILK
ncbi:M28 family peptidase [Melioribacter sp. OK-6-Me]|uniref:M28 family peptidase n=1 Tax=unclassified Melioribacter TaxID=2627329 RepID=UPI003ED90290